MLLSGQHTACNFPWRLPPSHRGVSRDGQSCPRRPEHGRAAERQLPEQPNCGPGSIRPRHCFSDLTGAPAELGLAEESIHLGANFVRTGGPEAGAQARPETDDPAHIVALLTAGGQDEQRLAGRKRFVRRVVSAVTDDCVNPGQERDLRDAPDDEGVGRERHRRQAAERLGSGWRGASSASAVKTRFSHSEEGRASMPASASGRPSRRRARRSAGEKLATTAARARSSMVDSLAEQAADARTGLGPPRVLGEGGWAIFPCQSGRDEFVAADALWGPWA